MSESPKTLTFEASAYLQRLIGRELVSTEEMAVVELVKNAYDAGAHNVVITVIPESNRETGEIVIRDDGEGMSLNDIKRVFLFAGYSEREEQIRSRPRVPTGEKGIGRFAADKLGRSLSVTTKTKGAKEAIHLDINWDDFENRRKKFNEIPVRYRESDIRQFANWKSGTVFQITRLRARWGHARIVRLRNYLSDLLDPFNPPQDFAIELQVPTSHDLTGPIPPPPRMKGDIRLTFKVSEGGKVQQELYAPTLKIHRKTANARSNADTKVLKGMEGRFIYFLDRPKKTETSGLAPSARLYRDGFRVQPFGGSRDWLGVAERKARRAGHAPVVPSHFFGFISIFRKKHPGLRHTTSRETFLDGEAAEAMITFLGEQLTELENNIRVEVTQPRWTESLRRQLAEAEQGRFQTLSIVSVGLAHELRQPLQVIRGEADNIKERLAQLKIEDRDVDEAQQSIDRNVERIDRTIQVISEIANGNVNTVERIDLAILMRELGEFLRPRANAKGIDFEVRTPRTQPALVNTVTVRTVVINLVQNAIDAFDNTARAKKIKLVLSRSGKTNFFDVVDNGPGIHEDVKPNIFRRFASKKTGGWGIGLYNCKLLVTAHGGKIDFTSKAGVGTTFRVEIPDEAREE